MTDAEMDYQMLTLALRRASEAGQGMMGDRDLMGKAAQALDALLGGGSPLAGPTFVLFKDGAVEPPALLPEYVDALTGKVQAEFLALASTLDDGMPYLDAARSFVEAVLRAMSFTLASRHPITVGPLDVVTNGGVIVGGALPISDAVHNPEPTGARASDGEGEQHSEGSTPTAGDPSTPADNDAPAATDKAAGKKKGK